MDVYVNGDRVTVRTPSPRIANVLEALGYECKKVVVAVNETFVARDEWPSYFLQPRDRLEVLGVIEGG